MIFFKNLDAYGKEDPDNEQCGELQGFVSVGHEIFAVLKHGNRLINKPISQCYYEEETSGRTDVGPNGGTAGGSSDARQIGGRVQTK